MVVIVGVAGFLLLGGGDDGGGPATGVGAKFRALGGSFETLPARPNLRVKGQSLSHVPELPEGFKYNSNPPSSGIHADETLIWGIYDEPVPMLSTPHNLEHGGIVIRYGPDLPASEVEKIRGFYLDDPNGLLVAPMPGLGDTIALTAWTLDESRRSERNYEGEGRIAKINRFDEDAFKAFVDAFRGKGPERIPVSDLKPGGS